MRRKMHKVLSKIRLHPMTGMWKSRIPLSSHHVISN
jgi:hypothetical protein